jgi:hypothetical protein
VKNRPKKHGPFPTITDIPAPAASSAFDTEDGALRDADVAHPLLEYAEDGVADDDTGATGGDPTRLAMLLDV